MATDMYLAALVVPVTRRPGNSFLRPAEVHPGFSFGVTNSTMPGSARIAQRRRGKRSGQGLGYHGAVRL